MWFKANCDPGHYLIYALTPWKRKVNEFSFSVYGPCQTQIQIIDKNNAPPMLLENIIIDKAKRDKTTLKSFQAQGQPSIFYKFESGSDAIGYFYFGNQSQDSQLTATIDIQSMNDCELMPPYSGMKPQVIVGPGEDRVMIYKMNGTTAKLNFKLLASFKKQARDLAEMTKSKGFRMGRTDPWGNQLDIALYVLYHEDGMVALYENNTFDCTLVEDVQFSLQNCKIEGVAGSSIRARVAPRATHVVNIVKSGPGAFAANVTSCTYQIFRQGYY